VRLIAKFLLYNSFFILFLFNSVWAANTSYYVAATSGNDSNTGLSHAQAWKTLSKVNSFSFSSGDNVYLLCGETWSSERLTTDWSGTVEDNVVIGAYYMDGGVETVGVNGDGKPIIDGQTTYPTSNLEALISTSQNVDYITIQDIEVKNSAGYGIRAAKHTSYITVQRCKIDTTYRNNILFSGSNYGNALYNECTNGGTIRLEVHGWPQTLSMHGTTGGTIKYNYVYNQYGEGIGVGDYCTVMYNLVVDTKSVGIYLNGSNNSEVAYNLVVGTNDTTYTIVTGWHGPGICLATENNTSTVADCENNKIHHNTIINTYAGIRMYESNDAYYNKQVRNNYIYNNTFIDNYGNFMLSNTSDDIDVSTIYVKNNISYPNSAESSHQIVWGGSTLDNWTCDYNNWAVDAAPSNAFLGAHDVTGNPNFAKSTWRSKSFTMDDFLTSDFFPKDGSSAIDSGVDLGSNFSNSLGNGTDFNATNPDPNNGVPILIFKESQYDNTPWEIGATKSTGDPSSTLQAPEGLKLAIHQ